MCDIACARSIIGVMDAKGNLPIKWLFMNSSHSIGPVLQEILIRKGFQMSLSKLKKLILSSEFFKDANERNCLNEDGPQEFRFSAIYVLSPKAKKVFVYYPKSGYIDKQSLEAKIGDEVDYVLDLERIERVAEFSKRKHVDFESLEMEHVEKLERRLDKEELSKFPDRLKEELKERIEAAKALIAINGIENKKLESQAAGSVSPSKLVGDTLHELDNLLKELADLDAKKSSREEKIFNLMEIKSLYNFHEGRMNSLHLTGAFVFKDEGGSE